MIQHINRFNFAPSIEKGDPNANLRQSLAGLANATGGGGIDPNALSRSDPFLAAFRLVSGDTSVFAPPPAGACEETSAAAAAAIRLRYIARHGRRQVRQIRLIKKWWRSISGPLIALRVDGSPVAILPTASCVYQIVDPRSGECHRLTFELAEKLLPQAFEVTTALPGGPLAARQLFCTGLPACRMELITLILIAVGTGLLAIAMPLATGMVVQTLIPEAYRSQLLAVGLGLATVTVATSVFRAVGEMTIVRLQTRLAGALLPAAWDRLLALPASFFRGFTAGDLTTRAWGIHQIQQAIVTTAGTAVFFILPGIFNLGLMFYLGWQIATWMLLLLTVIALVTAIVCRMDLHRRTAILAMEGAMNSQVLETLSGVAKLKAAGAEVRAYARWAAAFGKTKSAIFQAKRITTFFTVFASAVPTLGQLALFSLFLRHVCPNMSLGNLVSFIAAFGIVVSTSLSAAYTVIGFTRILPHVDRIRPMLQALPESSLNLPPTEHLSGRIDLKNITFRYGPHAPPALKDLSLSINAGEFVAIVGLSGSGKSTLLRVLLGIEQQQEGAILFDGRDSRLLDLPSLRQQIGTVVQNGTVLCGSIMQIVAGQTQLSADEVADLIDRVGLGSDVRSMPMGMHTYINDRAGSLSGGQRQQLMMARALAGKPRILLLDEATSALDNISQSHVSRSIEQCRVTRVVIAHRMSTIRNADRIVVMSEGKILQTGTFSSLSKEPGMFADLMQRQTSGYAL